MEATSKHDFKATAEDELSFNKGQLLKILSQDEELNWYKAEHEGKEGLVPSNYIEMKAHPWYINKVNRAESEKILLTKIPDNNQYIHPDGAFLVRPSETSPGDFSLSVKFGDSVQHFKVLRDSYGKYFLWVAKFNSLNELIEHHKTTTVSQSQTLLLRNMETVKAQYDFESQDPEELSFKKGELITIMEKNDRNWWKGKLMNEQSQGLFPSTYVTHEL